MSIMNCKSQQQTLSIRIPESLREFLELSREFITNGRGEAVPISDVAKLLLESAKQDRLDFRFEAADFCTPTGPKKMGAAAAPVPGGMGVPRSLRADRLRRAIGVHEYPQRRVFHRGTRSAARRACPPTDRGGGLDRFYLGNLDVPVPTVFSERQFDPGLLPHAVCDLMQKLRSATAFPKDVVPLSARDSAQR
jgi:hypothetical protein